MRHPRGGPGARGGGGEVEHRPLLADRHPGTAQAEGVTEARGDGGSGGATGAGGRSGYGSAPVGNGSFPLTIRDSSITGNVSAGGRVTVSGPVDLRGGTALGTGRGEELATVLARSTFHWVFAFAHDGLSPPAVFGEIDRLRDDPQWSGPPRLDDAEPLLAALATGDPHVLAPLLGNDLQPAALSLRSDLRRTLRAGAEAGALAGIVSGSGPTCAFLCTSAAHAVDVGTALSGAGVCRTVRVASGPVHGARVVPEPVRSPLCQPDRRAHV